SKNYLGWINDRDGEAPIMSHNLFAQRIAPHINQDRPTFMILIDNFRFDQWKSVEPIINEFFRVIEEDTFFSILPTSTQYSRNAIFSGLLPVEIERKFPIEWKNDDEQGGKNLYEKDFLGSQLKRLKLNHLRWDYVKITNNDNAK